MIIPIRCYSCGRITANKWNMYIHKVNNGTSNKDALNELNIDKMCCRQLFLCNVELIDKINKYNIHF